MRTIHGPWLLLLFAACHPEPADTGDSAYTGDSSDTGDSGDTADTADTADTGTWECDAVVDVCDGDACTWDIDTPLAVVSGALTFDGRAFAESDEVAWYLYFTNVATGTTGYRWYTAGPTWSAVLAPGVYDLVLSPHAVPEGARMPGVDVLVADDLVVEGDATVDLAVVTAELGGEVLLRGAPVPGDGDEGTPDYTLWFTEPGTGRRAEVQGNSGDPWTILLPVGTWQVVYQRGSWYTRAEPGELVTPSVVFDALVVSGDAVLELDVQPALVEGSYRTDGEAPDAAWELWFEDQHTGEWSFLAVAAGAEWSALVGPGTYDLYVDGAVRIADDLVVEAGAAGDTRLDADLSVHRVSGTALWNGGPIPDTSPSATVDYRVSFVEVGSDVQLAGWFRHDEDWALDVPDGTWDVYFSLSGSAPEDRLDLPARLVAGLEVSGDQSLELAVDSVELGGDARFDGQPIPDLASGADYLVQIADVASGQAASALLDHDEPRGFMVAEGTYDVSLGLWGTEIQPEYPRFVALAADDLVLIEDTTLTLETEAWEVGGAVTYGGGPVPETDWEPDFDFFLRFTWLETGATTDLYYAHDAPWIARLPEGTFSVAFHLQTGDDAQDLLVSDALLGECLSVGG